MDPVLRLRPVAVSVLVDVASWAAAFSHLWLSGPGVSGERVGGHSAKAPNFLGVHLASWASTRERAAPPFLI